ncbi:uncharacterized protein LOC110116443 [Dendrobium catenatum]|uniref:uncharacterized protein LOC110116443 n=1 Tax=Dendrobium catenatum TaxID=906689 RepID=UPI0009F4948C|nr:uncharacterized protein LOC110116443 [Dendrobium catenatum]
MERLGASHAKLERRVGFLQIEKRCKVKELNVTLGHLNTWWKQRAKVKWIEEGDANTKLFHAFDNARKNGNLVPQLKNNNGSLTEDPKEIEELFYNYFQKKWDDRDSVLTDWSPHWKVLNDEDRTCLEADLRDSEIWEVVRNSGNNTAPRFDGITYSFFKHYWSIVGMDVCMVVRSFFLTGRMDKDWKNNIVVLIPKSNNPVTPTGFQPISLYVHKAGDGMHLGTKLLYSHQWGKDLGIKITSKGQRISHLLYADDVLLFADAKRKSFKRLKDIIDDYCSWTGQRINYHKSAMIYGKRVDRRERKTDYQSLFDKSMKKLNSWSNKFISLAGRMVLVNSVYVNFPIFISSHSLIPLGVLKEFERLCRNYIWNKADGSHGLHYVAWNEICKPKALGGWGIKSALSSVESLRAKFAWKLVKSPNSLLNKNLLCKYGEDWWNDDNKKGGSPS